MTETATWVMEEMFVKHYPSDFAAATALHRTRMARTAGVPTPAVQRSLGRGLLVYDRVHPAGDASLPAMLASLALLHRMPPSGLSRLDPFLRINPRLADAPAHLRRLFAILLRQDRAINWPARTPVHGDFHPGQVILSDHGTVWLVDLDDMALAPPEADLGNLAAWFATQRPGDLVPRCSAALTQVLTHAPGANPALATHFCRIALLRRALKLAEKGQPWVQNALAVLEA
jgi:hypothetical protein